MVVATHIQTGDTFILGKEPFAVNWTKAELQKLHAQFFHASSNKLYEVLIRARPGETCKEVLRILELISAVCDTCSDYMSHLLDSVSPCMRTSSNLAARSRWTFCGFLGDS